MARQFIIGDIHGAHKALLQCFDKAGFDYENDILVCLGDVVDGWPDIPACIDELLQIKNLILLLGNHDKWALDWVLTGIIDSNWFAQGGKETIAAFEGKMEKKYAEFFKSAKLFHIQNNKLFVHAGINFQIPFEQNNEMNFLWDRSLGQACIDLWYDDKPVQLTVFDEVFIGHTPLLNFGLTYPVHAAEVWMMDTGAGWTGPLSMMDIDSKEIYQSSPTPELYPKHIPRQKKLQLLKK